MILLYQYIDISPVTCAQPDTDFSYIFSWFDDEGNTIDPQQSLSEGVYEFTFRRQDYYGTYAETILTLELNEDNDIPVVSVSAVNETDWGQNQIVVDGDPINLFGNINDNFNMVDVTSGTNICENYNDESNCNLQASCQWGVNDSDVGVCYDKDNVIYTWIYSVAPENINNGNTLTPTILASSINSNLETIDMSITLEAQDPFQILDGESSISQEIVITVVNDNEAPVITSVNEGIDNYEIIEDGSGELNYLNVDPYIEVSDAPEDSFTLTISQSDIDSDPVTYANYSLTGSTTIVPDDDFYGQIVVPIRINDGYTVSDTCYNCESEIADLIIDVIGVNDAPVLTTPETLYINEDEDFTVTDEIMVEDVDSENSNLEFQILVEKGTLSLSSNTGSINYSSGDGIEDNEMIFTASVTNFNNAISGAIFHPEYNYYGDEASITIVVDDLGYSGIPDDGADPTLTDSKTISIEINNINDPPVITSGDSYDILEDQTDFYITDIDLEDEDVDNFQLILELAVSNGTLELSATDGITCIGAGNCYGTASNMEFRGTLDVLNNAISNLHYVPNSYFNGLDVLQIRLNDMGNVGDEVREDNKNININVEAVNNPPTISEIGFTTASEDTLFNIENIIVGDVDLQEGSGELELSIDCPDCKVSLNFPIDGISFTSGNGFENNSMVFRGELDNINDAISNLEVIGNQDFCGPTSLQITANDLGNYSDSGIAESFSRNFDMELVGVNDPPVNQDPITSQEVLPFVSFSNDTLSLITTTGLWNDLVDEQCAPAPSEIFYTYQWQRAIDTTGVISNIDGANTETYFIGSDDADNYLRSMIIATDDGWPGSAQSDSAYSSFIKIDNLPPYVKPEYYPSIQLVAYEDSTLVIQLSNYVEDPDGNALTYSIEEDISTDEGILALTSSTGEIQFNPASNINFNSIPGFIEFSYNVADFQYTSQDPGTIIIRIRDRNDAPTFTTIDPNGDVNVIEDQNDILIEWADPLSINDGDDEVAQTLDFIIQSISNEDLFNKDEFGNCILSIDSFTGEISFELADNAKGTSDITVVLQDNGGVGSYPGVSESDTSESVTFTINVESINDPPTFDGGEDITIDEDVGTVNYPWASNMDDGDPNDEQNYLFVTQVLDGLDAMFIDLPAINAETGELSFTAAEDMNGEVLVKVVLDDDGNNGPPPNTDVSEPDTIRITINAINDAPSFSIDPDDLIIGDQTIIYEDSGLQTRTNFAQNIYDGDPLFNISDDQEIEFLLTNITNSGLFSTLPSIDENGTLTFTSAVNQNGESTITVLLKDSGGTPNDGEDESVAQIFTIKISAVNDAPFFDLTHTGGAVQMANGDTLFRFEDFSNPATISILPETRDIPEDEVSPYQSITYSIEPTLATNDKNRVFVELDIDSITGEITFDMIPNGNGEASFLVKATDSGPGEETGNGDVNVYTRSFNLIVNPLGDHPEVDLEDPPDLIFNGDFVSELEEVPLQVESLISIHKGTWIDTVDTNMSGTSNIIGYEYLWQAADNIDSDGLYDIGEFHPDSIDYIITNNEAHKYIRAIIRAIDDGWGDVSLSTLDEDDRFTDTTDWVQVINTKPVVVDDLKYFTWEDVPLTIDIAGGLISDDVSDTTTDYDKDLDSIWVNNYDLSTAWGQLDINADGSFYFDPSPPDLSNPNPSSDFHALSDTFGIVNFTYELIDEYGATSNRLGQVQIEVGSLNDPPEFTIQDESGSVIDTIEVLEDFEDCNCDNEDLDDIALGKPYIKLGFSVPVPGRFPSDPSDEINHEVNYSISPSIDFADINISNDPGEEGKIRIYPKKDWYGEQLLTVRALEPNELGSETGNGDDNDYEQSFYLKVVPVNDVPSFEMLPDTIVLLEDRGLFDTLNWIVNSDVGAILENHQELKYNISYVNDQDVNGDTWTFNQDPEITNDYDLNFKVSDNHNGISEVTISVQDDGGTTVDYLNEQEYSVGIDESESQTFFIKVLPVNDVPTFSYGINDTIDEDSGAITYSNWITNISAGPSNESFQHDSLEFSISAYDKFGHNLQGYASNVPNNVIFKIPPTLAIDSIDTTKAHLSFELNDNHNGLSYLRFSLNDKGGTAYSGVERSPIVQKEIYVRQINDKPKDFKVYAKPHEYAIDSTTFYIDTTSVEYFRLPYQEFAPDIQTPEKMRFSWERNDSLDVDTYATTNLDTLFKTYYRLEMTSDSSDYTYVLFDFIKGSQNILPSYANNLFFDDTSYFVDIDMTSLFPAYKDTFVFDASWGINDTLLPRYDTLRYIDTTGFTNYKWNVVAQNYSRDIYNHDISNEIISDRELVVDLEVPIAKYSFMQNDLYEEYYELYFNTSEETIENVASIWIEFSDSSIYRVPHKIDDYYFHLSSTFLNTGIINYNFQVRDLVENLGKSTKTVAFQFLEDGLAKTIHSPDNLVSIYSSSKSVDSKFGILLFAEDSNIELLDMIQMSADYHIFPYDKEFIDPIRLEFNNINIEDDFWKYQIRVKEDEEWVDIDTKVIDGQIVAEVINGGIYSVFYNPEAPRPIPEKFELVNLYPNPFNPILTIQYNVDIKQDVSIDIYNILGQKVNTLLNQEMPAGYHSITWNGKNNKGVLLGSGIYFIKIGTKNHSYVKKVSFIK